jgi:predicted adenine nucleotide alpha hydrolase (AANH) superfamily ATPase
MSQEEQEYYERRAEAEIALAQAAEHRRVVQAHYELASAYLDRIHGNEPRSEGGLFAG